ncbi:hypothetical protein PT974_10713 [Cladobotryum mycophilum]|uniref:Enoyl reductase (ER) domain-containing protein n=1 Tax=Cladobotryum mycophilum TaxID=491253 RepID=A0ABR0SC60_9HYPO
MSLPSTQKAVGVAANVPPAAGEVVIRVEWTAGTPLDLHRADGGLLIDSYPFMTGDGGAAGTVVAVGAGGDLKGLRVGDKVTSFAFRGSKEANHQEYLTVPAYLASKVPESLTLEEAVTVPMNLVTVFHTAVTDLDLEIPWPIPEGWKPKDGDKPVLVWGASSSVGIFAIQVFRHWGYTNILAVASGKHEEYLKGLGAKTFFDYTKPRVVERILESVASPAEDQPKIPYLLDCIGSVRGTLEPLTKIAQHGSRVAVMLPVIVKDATDEEEPEYEMDISKCLPGQWADGVILQGVRTHFYLQNELFKEKLQPEIVPFLLANKIIEPNKYRVIEGATMVERSQKSLDLLRNKAVSGERLVWRIWEE